MATVYYVFEDSCNLKPTHLEVVGSRKKLTGEKSEPIFGFVPFGPSIALTHVSEKVMESIRANGYTHKPDRIYGYDQVYGYSENGGNLVARRPT